MDENSPEAQFNKMMEQMSQQQNAVPTGIKKQGPSLEEQRVLNSIQTGTPVNTIPTTQGTCPDCDMIHPPVQPGQKCPNAKVKVETAEGKEQIDVTDLVIKIRDILVSQAEQKNVKDFKKFSGGLIVALMKYCEDYKE